MVEAVQAPAKSNDPAWLRIARAEVGVAEVPGPRHNPRILEYHKKTSLRATTDEVAWCSSFVNWVMAEAGYGGTGSAMARSWLRWGKKLEAPRRGCIVVMSRGSNPEQGHVGFLERWDNQTVTIVGGNQRNSVCEADFDRDNVLAYIWPKEAGDSTTVRAAVVGGKGEFLRQAGEALTPANVPDVPPVGQTEIDTLMQVMPYLAGGMKLVGVTLVFGSLAYIVIERIRRMRENGT